MMTLEALGWDSFFEKSFEPYALAGLQPARLALEHKHVFRLYSEQGEIEAGITGRMRHEALSRQDLPAVGDWVAVRARQEQGKATIHAILPRKSRFVRKVAGHRAEEQIVGANINTVFLVMALNNDYNVRRIERYLAAAWESGARPVVVLSKADLSTDVEAQAREVEAVAMTVPVHVISVRANRGLEELDRYFYEGHTVALLGSSGVGKSTLINRVIGRDVQKVNEVREHDDRGKHTTTHRELILLPKGGLVLDTPGMRELQLWDASAGVQEAFDDIEDLAARCHFTDCQHRNEPACAVREAVEEGTLTAERFENYKKLQKEQEFLSVRQEFNAKVAEKRRWKKVMQEVRKNENRR